MVGLKPFVYQFIWLPFHYSLSVIVLFVQILRRIWQNMLQTTSNMVALFVYNFTYIYINKKSFCSDSLALKIWNCDSLFWMTFQFNPFFCISFAPSIGSYASWFTAGSCNLTHNINNNNEDNNYNIPERKSCCIGISIGRYPNSNME